METIKSLTNQKVKDWVKLKLKDYREQTGLFLVAGEHLVLEALKHKVIKELIVTEIPAYGNDVPQYQVTPEIMKKISGLISPPDIIAICYKKEAKTIGNQVLLLDTIQDPGNLGTIIRSAVAFGIDTIVLSPGCVDLYNDKVIRASEGMVFHLSIFRQDLLEIINELKTHGYKIYGTDVHQGTKLKQIKFPIKKALIIGNEGNGVNQAITAACDIKINIPMAANCESLNVAMATTIILYEMAGQDHE